MRALYVTSELYPLVKTGGLADVSAALPAALRELDIDARVLMPAYPQALERAPHLKEVARLGNLIGCGEARLLETSVPGTRVPVWLVDSPALYNRAGGLYQSDEGADWTDNAQRFGLLNHAALAIVDGSVEDWVPDVIHANDWHAGLLPFMLRRRQEPRPATVFTIHNLAYQGLFDRDELDRVELAPDTFPDLEFYGRISFLKAGIHGADALTTVSPTYAEEILTPEYGCGFDGLLRGKASGLKGILNGADYGVWDPKTDPYIEAHFSPRSLAPKAACKRALQHELGLESDPDAPLMAFMSRLVHQKMPDVVLDALPALIEEGMQFALVAEGDRQYQLGFERLAAKYPGKLAVRIGYEEGLAHRLLAGADMLAHPARFEPCGLVPIYAMRYGALPIVRNSGGMADSVVDATLETMQKGTATGFSFDHPTSSDFAECSRRALGYYRQPLAWRKIQAHAMGQDFSWRRSAETYAQLYRSLVATSAATHSVINRAKLSA
jgi:starch synthase